MKGSLFLSLSLLFVSFSAPADTGVSAVEQKSGFFGIDVNSYFHSDLKYDTTGLDIKFGGQLFPQHLFEAGIRLRTDWPDLMLKYNYDFTTRGHGKWIPGISAGLLFGANPKKPKVESKTTGAVGGKIEDLEERALESEDRYLSVGVDLSLYVERFVSKRISLLARLGATPEHIILSEGDLSNLLNNVHLYIAVGAKWHLR